MRHLHNAHGTACVRLAGLLLGLAFGTASAQTSAGSMNASGVTGNTTGAAAVDRVRTRGSLQGADLDGDWGRWSEGRLQPSASLRRRFDHLLGALGEVDPAALRAWIERELVRERGASAAREVLAVWDAYLDVLARDTPLPREARPDLQDGIGTSTANTNTAPNTSTAASAPARARERMGEAWALAFFGPERLVKPCDACPGSAMDLSLLTPAPPATAEGAQALQQRRVQRYGAAAAERLRAEDAQRWSWDQRLAQARERLRTLAASGAPTSDQAAELARRFSGPELRRARALLGLPP